MLRKISVLFAVLLVAEGVCGNEATADVFSRLADTTAGRTTRIHGKDDSRNELLKAV